MANEWRPDPSRYGGGHYKPPRNYNWMGWLVVVAVVAIVGAGVFALGGSSESANELGASANPVAPADEEPILLKVAVWDDTESTPPSEMELWARGNGSWFPDLEFGGDSVAMQIDDRKLWVYPDGRSGREIMVSLEPPADLIEDSTADSVTVAVNDRVVEVSGTSVSGRVYAR